jgi:predicted aspartyl protease
MHGFRVQVVGRLIEQQQIRLGQQQLAQRHTAALTAGQIVDCGVAGRAAQRFHGHFHLAFQVPQVLRVDLVLKLGAFSAVSSE